MTEYINSVWDLLEENRDVPETFRTSREVLEHATPGDQFYARWFGSVLARIYPRLSGPVLELVSNGTWALHRNAKKTAPTYDQGWF